MIHIRLLSEHDGRNALPLEPFMFGGASGPSDWEVGRRMIEESLVLNLEHGLHARPAAELVALAGKFKSTIHIIKNGNKADAKSILDLMTLAADRGSSIVLHIEGDDEQAARDALIPFLDDRLDRQKEG